MIGGKPIVLSAGGTGGHIFPAQALAAELDRRGHTLCVITDRRGANYEKAFPGASVMTVRSASPSGGLLAKSRAAVEIGFGTLAAKAIFRRVRPAAVVGFGGYPSIPAMLAAVRGGLPTLVHEQNAMLGRVNRLLAPRVAKIALSFRQTEKVRPVDEGKVVVTGNPVREAFAAVRDVPYSPPNGGAIRLLVFGGSQGASILSEVVPAALAALPAGLRDRFRVVQQCRAEDIAAARAAYAAAGITADLAEFIDDVPALMASAHLAITRSGASTVAELAAAGRPSILVPYPQATDDHQTANAKALVAVGGAWMMPQEKFTAHACRQTLEALLDDPFTLLEMAESAAKIGRVDAAKELADVVEQLAASGKAPSATEELIRRNAA